MRYHHIGIPTGERRDGETYLEQFKVYVSGFGTSEYGIEWMRFEPDSPLPELVRTVPHVAFEVDDLEEAVAGREVLIEPNSPSEGVRVAFVVENGAPVEFLETDSSAAVTGETAIGMQRETNAAYEKVARASEKVARASEKVARASEKVASASENVARAFVEAINSGSADRLSELMTDDHTFIDSDGKEYAGRERMREGWREYFSLVPDYRIDVKERFVRGDTVVFLGIAEGTFNRVAKISWIDTSSGEGALHKTEASTEEGALALSNAEAPAEEVTLDPENHWSVPAAWRAVVEGGRVAVWQLYVNPEPMWEILKRMGLA